MIKDNMYYWDVSLKTEEPIWDKYYFFDEIIVNPELSKKVKYLRDLIISYCTAEECEKGEGSKLFLDKIYDIINSVKNIQYTEFIAYWKTLDMTESVFKDFTNNNKLILEQLLQKYCERRIKLYNSLGYTDVTIQALYDNGSSRRKGSAAITKITDIYNYFFKNSNHPKTIDEFENCDTCYILPDKGDKKIFNEFKEKYGIKFAYGEKAQNKMPDFLLKYFNQFFIIEAKHLKEGGGTQNKSVLELIDFVRETEKDSDNVHYVGFMDGVYFNLFISSSDSKISSSDGKKKKKDIDKVKSQLTSIKDILAKNKNNFIVNTGGLKALFKDLAEEKQK
jgi:hypothetical protein